MFVLFVNFFDIRTTANGLSQENIIFVALNAMQTILLVFINMAYYLLFLTFSMF